MKLDLTISQIATLKEVLSNVIEYQIDILKKAPTSEQMWSKQDKKNIVDTHKKLI